MKVFFPNSAFIKNIENFLKKLVLDEPGKLDVSFHERWVSVHPVVLAMTGALAMKCKLVDGEITVNEITAASKLYFKRMGLLDMLDAGNEWNLKASEEAGRFIGLRHIQNATELASFMTDLIPLLHTSPTQFVPIQYVVSEVVRNSFEHSKSEMGVVVCAQYFKKANRVSVGIADCGVGILQHISKNHAVHTHSEAIRLALRPGITGTTSNIGGSESNAGAGLFFTKSITRASQDYMMIYSGNTLFKLKKGKPDKAGILHLYADPLKDKPTILSDMPFWQGTVVGIDITSGQSGAFESLMELIRNVYHLDVQSKKKEQFKKPRFT